MVEPKFEYLSEKANAQMIESIEIIDDRDHLKNEQDRLQKAVRKAKAKTGASLGWGWFQGFSLFVLGFLLMGMAVFLFFMVKDDPIHEGEPKYILSRNGVPGSVEINPIWSSLYGSSKSEQSEADPLKK